MEIRDEKTGEWIAKQDVGAVSYSEKEKGQASDSFKRACFNWGIGRELYTAPFIWIPAGKAEIQSKEAQNREKKYYCNDRFSISSIEYNNKKEISALVVVNGKGETVYVMKAKNVSGSNAGGKGVATSGKQKKEIQKNTLSEEQMASLLEELDRTGVTAEAVRERYKIQEMGTMSDELYRKVMAALSRTKSSKAA